MTEWYIKDYGLSPLQLEAKYAPDGDGGHPGFAQWEWRNEVNAHMTILGYWAWVQFQLEHEQTLLDRDNPYN
jgi:hypothetical protein